MTACRRSESALFGAALSVKTALSGPILRPDGGLFAACALSLKLGSGWGLYPL
jgi:hypothetical protein